jgi:hypothetical protein
LFVCLFVCLFVYFLSIVWVNDFSPTIWVIHLNWMSFSCSYLFWLGSNWKFVWWYPDIILHNYISVWQPYLD